MEKRGLENVSFQNLAKQYILMEMFIKKAEEVAQETIMILILVKDFGFRELKKMEQIGINMEKE